MGWIGGPIADAILNRYDWVRDPPSGEAIVHNAPLKLERLFGPTVWEEFAGKTVIDFGCERGLECIEIAKHGAAKVIGLDIRENVLAVARDLARDAGTDIEFTTSTAEKADVILSLDSFEHYSNPTEVIQTMAGLLKSGGYVLVSFGPIWFHPSGGHAFTIFPWSHILFTERAQMRWRNRFVSDPRERKTRFVDIGEPLNGMTIGRFKRIVADSPLKFDSLDLVPIKVLGLLHNWITQEFLTSVVQCRLTAR